jgi:Type IV secretion system pilin
MSFQLVSQAYAVSNWTGECVGQNVGGVDATDVASIQGIVCLLKNVLTPLPALLALVAVGVLILAGIRLTTAGAEPKAVASAWSMFTWAIIGLILLAVVWLALVLIENFTGAKVTQFGL